jgi:hypothetical protein
MSDCQGLPGIRCHCPAKTGRLPSRVGELTPRRPVYRHCYEKERRGKAFRRISFGETIVAYAIASILDNRILLVTLFPPLRRTRSGEVDSRRWQGHREAHTRKVPETPPLDFNPDQRGTCSPTIRLITSPTCSTIIYKMAMARKTRLLLPYSHLPHPPYSPAAEPGEYRKPVGERQPGGLASQSRD